MRTVQDYFENSHHYRIRTILETWIFYEQLGTPLIKYTILNHKDFDTIEFYNKNYLKYEINCKIYKRTYTNELYTIEFYNGNYSIALV